MSVDMKEVAEYVESYLGLQIPPQDLQPMLSKRSLYEIETAGFDTMTREMVMDDVSESMIRKTVPTFGDSQEVCEAFWKELYREACERGWQLSPNLSARVKDSGDKED